MVALLSATCLHPTALVLLDKELKLKSEAGLGACRPMSKVRLTAVIMDDGMSQQEYLALAPRDTRSSIFGSYSSENLDCQVLELQGNLECLCHQ